MRYLVTGVESSGTRFVAKYIAYCLGNIKSMDDPDWVTNKSSGKHIVDHSSLPHGDRDNFRKAEEFGPPKNTIIVVCIRDQNIAGISGGLRHNKSKIKQTLKLINKARDWIKHYLDSDYKVVLFSYETCVFLGQAYLKRFAKKLGITHKNVHIRDANRKYLRWHFGTRRYKRLVKFK
jgi:hypothetical protein